jgi:hypothetical protein
MGIIMSIQACLGSRAAARAEAEALLSYLGPAVLLNDLLCALIWGHLDAYDKKRLRAVGRGVRALADSNVVNLSMRAQRFVCPRKWGFQLSRSAQSGKRRTADAETSEICRPLGLHFVLGRGGALRGARAEERQVVTPCNAGTATQTASLPQTVMQKSEPTYILAACGGAGVDSPSMRRKKSTVIPQNRNPRSGSFRENR